ncbi:MAG: hypothetical protein JNM43_05550, partial [Planctomycetaceae bacterium]|nr:hypothetical protein [Planctomycetaceae bacterium]
MPIQFRCEYSQQLLGISQSRAGSMVDCPACGRSLLVPSKEGAPAKPAPSKKAQADARLLNALAELSGLGQLATETATPSTPSVPQPRSPKLTQAAAVTPKPAGSTVDQIRIVPLKPGTQDAFRELADIPEDDQPDEITDLEEPELIEEPEPESADQSPRSTIPQADPFREALQELTTLPPLAAAQPLPLPVPSTSRTVFGMLLLVTAVVTFGAGYLVGKSRTATADPSLTANPASSAPDPSRPSSSESDKTNQKKTDIPEKSDPAEVAGQLKGTVKYKNATGEMVADADALVILVPSKNTTNLRLDGRPLREEEKSPARSSIEAALNILQVSITRVGADGAFVVPQKHSQSQRLVVISRHKSRPDGESVAGDAQQTLADWFESTSHLVGRLAAKVVPIDAPGSTPTAAVDVTFE